MTGGSPWLTVPKKTETPRQDAGRSFLVVSKKRATKLSALSAAVPAGLLLLPGSLLLFPAIPSGLACSPLRDAKFKFDGCHGWLVQPCFGHCWASQQWHTMSQLLAATSRRYSPRLKKSLLPDHRGNLRVTALVALSVSGNGNYLKKSCKYIFPCRRENFRT